MKSQRVPRSQVRLQRVPRHQARLRRGHHRLRAGEGGIRFRQRGIKGQGLQRGFRRGRRLPGILLRPARKGEEEPEKDESGFHWRDDTGKSAAAKPEPCAQERC